MGVMLTLRACYVQIIGLALVVACVGGNKAGLQPSVADALPPDGPSLCRTPATGFGPTSRFDVLPNGTPRAAQTCPAACGVSAWSSSGTPMIDVALPYGACAPGTADCETLGQMPCACGANGGPTHAFKCGCEGGTWICRILFQGAALCAPCADAGPDSSTPPDTAPPTGDCTVPLRDLGIPVGTVATASASYAPSFTPDQAIDGLPTTGWNAGSATGWLTLRFPQPTAITAVQIVAGSKPTTNATYTITSDDKVIIGSGTREIISGRPTGSVLDPSPIIPGSYASLTITASAGASWEQILEVTLFAGGCPVPIPRCEGTLKSANCPVNVFSCPLGCTLIIGSGGYCTGAPPACRDNPTAEDCAKQEGCAWDGVTLACAGTPAPCAGKNYSECLAAGCAHVGDDPSCRGTPTPCRELSPADCARQEGCALRTDIP
jgi:hypothetical protein